jgi:hypothetical protein
MRMPSGHRGVAALSLVAASGITVPFMQHHMTTAQSACKAAPAGRGAYPAGCVCAGGAAHMADVAAYPPDCRIASVRAE